MGKLLVIDGLDGCGKSTQLAMLDAKLKEEGKQMDKAVKKPIN